MGALHVHFLLIVLLPNELLTIPSSRPWKQDILCSNRRGTTAKGIVLGSLWEVLRKSRWSSRRGRQRIGTDPAVRQRQKPSRLAAAPCAAAFWRS